MNVIHKLFSTVFLLIVVSLFYAYYTPTISSNNAISINSSDSEKADYNNTTLNKNDLPESKLPTNKAGSSGRDIVLTDYNNANSEIHLDGLIGSWSPYLEKNSEEYKNLLVKYQNSEEKVIVDGGNAYIADKINEEIQ